MFASCASKLKLRKKADKEHLRLCVEKLVNRKRMDGQSVCEELAGSVNGKNRGFGENSGRELSAIIKNGKASLER